MVADLSLAQARRIALAAQGFDGARRNDGVGTDDLSGIVDRLGLIQLDSVNVVVRSHYMPFFSRLGSYDRPLVEKTPQICSIKYLRGKRCCSFSFQA